jgi:hypothetical protein
LTPPATRALRLEQRKPKSPPPTQEPYLIFGRCDLPNEFVGK